MNPTLKKVLKVAAYVIIAGAVIGILALGIFGPQWPK